MGNTSRCPTGCSLPSIRRLCTGSALGPGRAICEISRDICSLQVQVRKSIFAPKNMLRATSTRLLEHALDGLGLDGTNEFAFFQLRIASRASASISLQASASWASAEIHIAGASGYDKCSSENCTGGAEQVHGRVAEPSGDQTRGGAGTAVGDVEKGNEGSHRATPVCRQHALERLHSERREDQGAAKSGDEGATQSDDLVRGAPDQHLANRLNDEGPKRHAIAADLVGQMPEHEAYKDEAETEGSHNKPGMAPAARSEIERGEGGEAG